MERLCFTFEIYEGQEAEYKRRHDEIWPELVEVIQQSGLKNYSLFRRGTQIVAYVEAHPEASQADVAAGFQEAVADVLTAKAVRAATDLGVSTLLIAGGVAANSRLRELAEERCAAAGLTLRVPRPRLCTDNGAMIASFAAHLIAAGADPSPLDAASDPGLPVVKGQVA